MDVESGWRTLLLEAANPASIVLVAILVHRGHVHKQDVGDVRFQVIELYLDGREHPPAERERVNGAVSGGHYTTGLRGS